MKKTIGWSRSVWASNVDSELSRLHDCLRFYPILSMDTEFPGHIRSCSSWGSNSTDQQTYEHLRFNVNQTKLLQLGLTASDEFGNVGDSWEFNFSDFDPQTDAQNPQSISFLKQNGLDFDKLKNEGIPLQAFTAKFFHILRKNHIFRWVTFHDLYDIAYLLKAMGVVKELPESMEEFANLVVKTMGSVRDLKHMARYCEGLEQGKLGLERLGQLLDQKRFGEKHHAGSDSLLTASLYGKMMQRFQLNPAICDGYLYGLSNNLHSMVKAETKLYPKIRFVQISYPVIPVYCTPFPYFPYYNYY